MRQINLSLEETLFKTKILPLLTTSLEKVTFLQVLHWKTLISTSKHHLEQMQYAINMEFVTRTRCLKKKFKLPKNLPPTYKMHQFQTADFFFFFFCIKTTHPAEDPECLELYWKKSRLRQ